MVHRFDYDPDAATPGVPRHAAQALDDPVTGNRGVRFLGVFERDDAAKGRAWVKEFDVTYPSIADPSGSFADDFALFGLPDTFVIDPNGTIRWVITGKTTQTELSRLIDRLLAASGSPSASA